MDTGSESLMKKLIAVLLVNLCVVGVCNAQSNKVETSKALQKLNQWKQTNGDPVIDEEGRVLFVFGESFPQVVCAPLALCDIRMQPGEEIVSVRVGDKVRWVINNARSGSGANVSEHLIVKPTSAGLVTTLFVGTNRRVYVIELVSDQTQFMSKVGFLYNDNGDESDSFTSASDVQLLPAQQTAAPPILLMSSDSSEPDEAIIDEHEVLGNNLNFKYQLSGPRVAWMPIRVYDDGVKTYIDMDQKLVSARELPVFLNNDTDRRGHMINYRFVPHDARFIVDGLFDRGSLVLGEGKKQKKIRIVREHVADHDNHQANLSRFPEQGE